MSKSVLGRGLGSLMGEVKTGKTESPNGEPTAKQQPLAGPGVDSLLRGTPPPQKDSSTQTRNIFSETQPAPEEKIQKRYSTAIIPRWYFFAADMLLVAGAWLVACKSPGTLSEKEILFCAASIIFGSILGVIGVLMNDRGSE